VVFADNLNKCDQFETQQIFPMVGAVVPNRSSGCAFASAIGDKRPYLSDAALRGAKLHFRQLERRVEREPKPAIIRHRAHESVHPRRERDHCRVVAGVPRLGR
jgi:hypothetical protein